MQEHVRDTCQHTDMHGIYTRLHEHIYIVYICPHTVVHTHQTCFPHAVYLTLGVSHVSAPLGLSPLPCLGLGPGSTSLQQIPVITSSAPPKPWGCRTFPISHLLPETLRNQTTGLSERLSRCPEVPGCCKPGSCHLHASALVGPPHCLWNALSPCSLPAAHAQLRDFLNSRSQHSTTAAQLTFFWL